MADDANKKAAPAYSTYKTLMTFVDSLAGAMPTVIDRSIMTKMSGSGQAAILSSLRFLKLVDHEDRPTGLLHKLAGAEGDARTRALNEMLTEAYSLIDTLDLSTATTKQVEDWFRSQGVRGSTVTRAFTFFVNAAEDAGITLSTYLRNSKPKASSSSGSTKKKATPRRKVRRSGGGAAEAPAAPKGSTKYDLPVPGSSNFATLILPDDISSEDWELLRDMFDKYAERHVAAAEAGGDSD